MRRKLKTLMTATAMLGALAAGTAVYAQSESGGSQGPGGMMGQGGMMGMMNMMQQMSQMMETCNKMMAQHHGPATPKEETAPEKKG